VKHKSAVRLHRTTGEHRAIVVRIVALDFKMLEYIAVAQIQWTIDYYPHRALIAVLTQVGDAVRKQRICKSGHRNEEMIF